MKSPSVLRLMASEISRVQTLNERKDVEAQKPKVKK